RCGRVELGPGSAAVAGAKEPTELALDDDAGVNLSRRADGHFRTVGVREEGVHRGVADPRPARARVGRLVDSADAAEAVLDRSVKHGIVGRVAREIPGNALRQS